MAAFGLSTRRLIWESFWLVANICSDWVLDSLEKDSGAVIALVEIMDLTECYSPNLLKDEIHLW